MKKEKKCRRCELRRPLSKFKHNPTLARRRERVCDDCHAEMAANPSKYIPTLKRLDLIKNEKANPSGYRASPRAKIITDIARIKEIQAIFKVPVNILKTQAHYMAQQHKETQKRINIR